MSARILWNRRPANPVQPGSIDEIVVTDCAVHIEQMGDECYWISIRRSDGTEWQGNFWGLHLNLGLQESDIVWERDESHEDPR